MVIVGAGVGGLCAAAELGLAGLSVLVLDGEPHVGGTASCYRRGGFTFPTGPLGFSSPRYVRRRIERLGGEGGFGEGLRFRRVAYSVRAYGVEAPLSLPHSRPVDELTRCFPADARGIGAFFARLDELAQALRSPDQPHGAALLEQAQRVFVAEYLAGTVGDRRLQRILGSMGTEPPSFGLPLLAAMWRLMGKVGIWYPAGGMGAFCERLGTAARGAGAEVRLRSRVAAIRVTRGRARGVELDDGTVVDAKAVVSDADYKTTVLRLLDAREIPDEWRAAVAAARQTASNLQVALGLDASRCDLSAFDDGARIIYRSPRVELGEEGRVDWAAPGPVDPALLARQELEVALWSRDDAHLAPRDGAVLVIRTKADHAHFARYRPAVRKRVPEYAAYKRRLGEALADEVERLVPGLTDAVRVVDVATPLTFEERGGRAEGAVAGWSWAATEGDWRPRELVLTPVAGLYMAGHQALSALFRGGVPTALEAGHRAARDVLAGAPPETRPAIPGATETA